MGYCIRRFRQLARQFFKVFCNSCDSVCTDSTRIGVDVHDESAQREISPVVATGQHPKTGVNLERMYSDNNNLITRTLDRFEFGTIALYSFVVAVSIATAIIVVKTNGNVGAALAFILALVVVMVSFYKVEWAFYLLFGMVLLFDQFLNPMPGGVPITAKFGYFMNLKQNPYLPPFSAGVMNPIEIQLALILAGWFFAISARKSRKIIGLPFWGFGLLLLLAIVAAEFHGLRGGGIFLRSLWEIRAMIYFLLLYYLVPQIIQTRKQVNVLLWIFIVIIGIKALQGGIRLAQLGFRFDGYTVLTNHEDPVFTADLFILFFGFLLFDAKTKHRTAIKWLLPILLLGFYAGQRRAAYAGFFVCLGIFIIMLKPGERKKFFRATLPVIIALTAYTAIFWNYHGRLAEPIQLVKSGFMKSAKGSDGRYDSNLYREYERYDLAATIKSAPILGIGWGKEYLQPIPLVNIGFSLQDWITHCEILWLFANMGAIGFFIFFLFMDSLVFQAAHLGRTLKDPYLRSFAFMIAAMVVNQVVVSYLDLQLTFYRDMIFLGTFSGLLPILKILDREENGHKDSGATKTPARERNPVAVAAE